MSRRVNQTRAPAPLKPEAELLLACARACLAGETSETSERVNRLATRSLDWEKLVQLALHHKVLPLVFEQLNTSAPQAAPPHVLERLRELFHLNAARNQFLFEELCRLDRALAAEGVRAIWYKGHLLAQEAYGDMALRQFNDLDLMVQPCDVPRVSKLLRDLGYEPQWQLTRAQETAYLRGDCERLFGLDAGRVFLDLHWAIVRNHFALKLDYEGFWRRSLMVMLQGVPLRSFAVEDLFIILSAHASKDLWTRLVWICDLAMLAQRGAQGADWRSVLARAETAGARRMLLVGLRLAQDLLGLSLSEEVLRALDANEAVERLALEVRTRLFNEPEREPGSLAQSLFHLRMHERLSERTRYAFRFLMTTNPADWKFIALPDRLFFLYHLVRPLRLLVKPR